MSPHDPDERFDQHDDRLDDELSRLLSDAVSDVEPSDALDTIRNRTKVTLMSTKRPWLLASGGAVVATAAVLTAIAFAGGVFTNTADDDPGPAERTSQGPDRRDDSPTPDPEPTETGDPGSGTVVPVYLAGDTPAGVRLYREFQMGAAGTDPILAATRASVEGQALDPDYRSLWPAGSTVSEVEFDGADIITVTVAGAPEERPAGMTEEEARIAVQQVVYTAQAALGQGRVGVQFLSDKGRITNILGEAVNEPLANTPILETLALVSLTSPTEGEQVSGDTLTVSGVANSFEANVVVRLQPLGATETVLEMPITAEGWMGEQLFPFEDTLDLSGIPAGEYLLTASTDDPSGGTEGTGPHTDTRTIVIG
ncbi:Gmad2 immunoglobulin-like domain-containing protein [Nocardioides sp. GCM10027113]|uniref:Gmad2 immunoglobulin-like domain-containing protein n=1 Tax=unclassified Nocardioides TaxID=2615069 RepID=UPI00361A1E66